MKPQEKWQRWSELLEDASSSDRDLYLTRQYARLRLSDMKILRMEYKDIYKSVCSKYFDREALIKALMDHYVQSLTEKGSLEHSVQGSTIELADGTILEKRYKGKKLIIKCVAGNYLYDGSMFGSLTEVARHITKTQCSGPRFFRTGTIIHGDHYE
jgi:hypothetical protein